MDFFHNDKSLLTIKNTNETLYKTFTESSACTACSSFRGSCECADGIEVNVDTLTWDIIHPDSFAYGTAYLTVYYEGDFGATSEFINIYDEDMNPIGVTQSYFDGSDCMKDSVTLAFPSSMLDTWGADDTIRFTGITTANVDFFCTTNHAQVKLEYVTCATGGPFASLSAPQTTFCGIDSPVTVNPSPAGGTLTGQGLTGNVFNPGSLPPGSYVLTYTYTNAGGCTSTFDLTMTINEGAFVNAVSPDTICPFNVSTFTAEGSGHLVWYTDAALTNPVDTGNTFTTPSLTTTTTYYVAAAIYDTYFRIDTLTNMDSAVVDHDAWTGDDRGGIAVTMNYLYVVGDDSTVRFDLDLQNPMNFPRMDGLVSDLATGQLYTLYNPLTGAPDANSIDSMYVTELHTLNADLTLGATTITLSDSIPFGWDNAYNYESGIFAGNGFVILYSSPRSSWYVIDMQDGVVTNLGKLTTGDPQFNYSETWSVWGVAEFDGTTYNALYRDENSSNISRRALPSGTPTVAAQYSDLSDMASFTYAPWNNRVYMHFEGGSEFNGQSETVVYATASDSTGPVVSGGNINCPAAATVFVDACTGIEENSAAAFSVYPNPNNGVFTISLSNMANATLEIISIDGSVVYTENYAAAQNVKEINLSSIANGVYFVRVSNNETVITSKLVKQ
jgi:hypothetical protein